MVEGRSGLIAVAPPWSRPRFKSSKRRVEWPIGASAVCLSGEEPERAGGLNIDTLWADELVPPGAIEGDAAVPGMWLAIRRRSARLWSAPVVGYVGRGFPCVFFHDEFRRLANWDRPPGECSFYVRSCCAVVALRSGVYQ
jgi:hypothetical protein